MENEKTDLTKQVEDLKKSSKVKSNSSNAVSTASTSSTKAVTTSSQKSTTASSTTSSQSYTVYITNTGKKYHRSGCSYLKKSQFAISVSSAKAQGYTPCSRCNP